MQNRRTWLQALALAALGGRRALAQSQKKAAADPAAQALLRRMGQVYATAKTYEDQGEVRTTLIKDGHRNEVVKPFRTAFERPNRFKFQFTTGDEPNTRLYVVWTDRGPARARRWWTLKPRVEEDTLALALAGGTGISGGSAHTIPRLLLPETVNGWALTDLGTPRIAGEEAVGGVPCTRVEGAMADGSPMTVWIGKEQPLVYRTSSRRRANDFESVEMTTYEPRLNGVIKPESFAFEPPK